MILHCLSGIFLHSFSLHFASPPLTLGAVVVPSSDVAIRALGHAHSLYLSLDSCSLGLLICATLKYCMGSGISQVMVPAAAVLPPTHAQFLLRSRLFMATVFLASALGGGRSWTVPQTIFRAEPSVEEDSSGSHVERLPSLNMGGGWELPQMPQRLLLWVHHGGPLRLFCRSGWVTAGWTFSQSMPAQRIQQAYNLQLTHPKPLRFTSSLGDDRPHS